VNDQKRIDSWNIKEVKRFSDLPASNDPDLEVGDVYRVTDDRLNPSGTVLKWDGRAWVPLRGVEPVQNKSDGKKDVPGADGATSDRSTAVSDDAMRSVGDGLTNGHKIVYPYDNAPGAGECYYCGGHDFDDPCWYGPATRRCKRCQAENVTDVGMWGEKESVRQVQVDDPDWIVGGGRVEPALKILKRHDIQARDADADVLGRWMPRDFVTWYVAVVNLIDGGSGSGVDETAIPGLGRAYGGIGTSKSEASESLKLNSKKMAAKSSVLMRNEWASVVKENVDRKLRKIARELKNKLDDDVKRAATGQKRIGRKCSGKCGKFGESDWVYCARCGGPMQEIG
jgi:hypothetical protein